MPASEPSTIAASQLWGMESALCPKLRLCRLRSLRRAQTPWGTKRPKLAGHYSAIRVQRLLRCLGPGEPPGMLEPGAT